MADVMIDKFRLISVALFGLLFAGCMPQIGVTCEIDGSQYALRGHPGFTAHFRASPETPSVRHLTLDVRSKDTGRTYSFLINRGNGYGETTLIALHGNLSEPIEVYTVDEKGEFSDFFGSLDKIAPKNLLLPKLGPALWYNADELSGHSSAGRIAERMPRAFFDRIACGPAKP